MDDKTKSVLIATPIMNVGIRQGSQEIALPFFRLDTINEKGRAKRIYCNWTYGYHSKIMEQVQFTNEIGQVKFQLLNHLIPEKPVVLRVMTGKTEADIKKKILGEIWASEGGSRILFVWDKETAEDNVFYEALELVGEDGPIVPEKILTLSETGLNLEKPFQELGMIEGN